MSEVLRRNITCQHTVPATDSVLVDVVNLLLQKIEINQPTHFSFPAIKLLMTNIACLLVMEINDDIFNHKHNIDHLRCYCNFVFKLTKCYCVVTQ